MKYRNYPIDKELEYIPNDKLVALKYISCQEPIFNEHFPDFNIYPGSMVIASVFETFRQFIKYSQEKVIQNNSISLKNIRFKKMCLPGEILKITVEAKDISKWVYSFTAHGYFDDEILCTGGIQYKEKRNGR
ncbi:hotdog family protein [Anaeromicropila populeti]|uniref:3-hydroxyacyl-[acyl-carrier-protein] dehydratase n=1 Tax=Anaeromicropila populeti TaxID=37658 RepID=A0A1I6HS95_9FIRM|nr:hypothetical protein [Anaeromicropila populeti]SFR57294.1 3-hydroxyacyl-[acyl-carrier-protein] dehydratase [Anaeromicropila populeti]